MVGKNSEWSSPMSIQHDPNHLLPSFLSDHADEYEQQGAVHDLLDTPIIPKASILAMAVMVGGVALALSLGNPVELIARAAASLPDNSAVQRGAGQSTSATQAFAPTQGTAPARDQIADIADAAQQAQTNQPQSAALLGQFQAWAAKEDEQAQEQAQEKAQEQAREQEQRRIAADRLEIEATYAEPEQPVQKHRKVRSVQNERTEVRHVQKPKARAQRQQIEPGLAPSRQEALAQAQPVQGASAPSFLQSIGMHQ
jgi:hypothetical protein